MSMSQDADLPTFENVNVGHFRGSNNVSGAPHGGGPGGRRRNLIITSVLLTLYRWLTPHFAAFLTLFHIMYNFIWSKELEIFMNLPTIIISIITFKQSMVLTLSEHPPPLMGSIGVQGNVQWGLRGKVPSTSQRASAHLPPQERESMGKIIVICFTHRYK